MITYKTIVNACNAFADNHHIIKGFGAGELWQINDHDQDSAFEYPLQYMVDVPSSPGPKSWTYAFRVYFVSRVEAPKDRDGSPIYFEYTSEKSAMLSCAQDFLSYWVQDVNYKLTIEQSLGVTTFIDAQEDGVTGCYVDIRFVVPFTYDSCIIPMDGVPAPDSLNVEVYVNDVLRYTLTPSSELLLNVIDTNGDPVDATISGTNIIVPAAVVCNPVTMTFNGASITSTPAGDSKTITFKNTSAVNVGVKVTDTASVLEVEAEDVDWTDSDGSAESTPYGDPIVCTPSIAPVNSGKIYKTGATVANNAGDDGNIKRGAGTDFFNMGFDNPFGNQKAYTGTTGGYYDEVALSYKDVNGNATTEALAFPDKLILNWKAWSQIDNEVFCMDYTPIRTGTVASMILASPYTRGGFTGFYVLNMGEYERFFNYGGTAFNWPPFSFTIGAPDTSYRAYSSTPFGTNYYAYVSTSVTNQLAASVTGTVFVGRYLNITTDLGL